MINELTIVNQPKHTILSVIVFNVDTVQVPLDGQLHDNLFRLTDETDVIFIFHGDQRKIIDLDKFSSIYGACGWIYGEDITEKIFQVLQYGKEIIESYVSYMIGNISDIIDPGLDKILEKAAKVNMSDIVWPIFKTRRLSSEELYKIYHLPSIKEKKSVKDPITAWYDKFWINDEDKPKDPDNRYSTWTSSSRLMFFKNRVIGKFVDLWYTDEGEREWLETFTWDDPKYLLASLTKHLNLETQDVNLEDLNYGGSSERKKSKVSK